jgi:hypothetical protein
MVYDEGTQKLITGYDKCRNAGGDCVEKWRRVCNSDALNILKLFYLFFFITKESSLSG